MKHFRIIKHIGGILITLLFVSLVSCGDKQTSKVSIYPNTTKSDKVYKKVLVISSSPRKGGNSDLLCDEFMKGAQASGHFAEKVFLNDKGINFFVRDDYTVKDSTVFDDAPGIVQKMVDADVIVLATPVYFYTMCGQMKTLIDRTYDRYREIKGKEFYYIITAAIQDKSKLQRTIEEFRGYLECLPSASECGIIYGIGTWMKGDVKKTVAMKNAYKMGKEL